MIGNSQIQISDCLHLTQKWNLKTSISYKSKAEKVHKVQNDKNDKNLHLFVKFYYRYDDDHKLPKKDDSRNLDMNTRLAHFGTAYLRINLEKVWA